MRCTVGLASVIKLKQNIAFFTIKSTRKSTKSKLHSNRKFRKCCVTEATSQHGHQVAVHGDAHDRGQDHTGGGHESSSNDKQLVTHHETSEDAGDTGARVQDADDDRHVGAADGHHEEDT